MSFPTDFKKLLSITYVPDTVLSARDTEVNNNETVPFLKEITV